MSYCRKHDYPENQCAACVKEAVENNTFVLDEILAFMQRKEDHYPIKWWQVYRWNPSHQSYAYRWKWLRDLFA